MEEGKRQKQIAGVIAAALDNIFRNLNLNIMNGGMVSISKVKVTPDLLEARIYVSFFKIENTTEAFNKVVAKQWEIKKQLALEIKKQVRRIPELRFFIDDTLDYVFKMEEVFKKIKDEEIE